MPRPERRCEPYLTYHTMSRCLDWKDMMKADKFKEIFIQVIRKTQEKYEFELIFYQIMDNHFHLVIRTISEEISMESLAAGTYIIEIRVGSEIIHKKIIKN